MRKNIVAIISFFILIVVCLVMIICFRQTKSEKNNEKIQIIATLFPQYDFAKHIVGDKAEVNLLLNSGVETHNYEPTPKDMVLIHNSDMFLYTGNELEPWTEKIINNVDKNCKVVDISQEIELIKIEEFEERHINNLFKEEKHYDNHESEHHYEEAEEHNESYKNHEHNHSEIYDGHIWLNPQNAIKMIDNIVKEICEIDQENETYYKKNAEDYKKEIMQLDTKLEEIVKNSKRKEIAVGGEFAYAYLVDRYGIDFVRVYNNCGEGEDPSIAKVKSVIDYMKQNDMNIVFYEELSEGTIAKMIAEETKAQSLILYSIHNADISKDTYVSLFEKNINNLAKSLK